MVRFIGGISLVWAVLMLTACVKTEIVPEVLDPKLSISRPANGVVILGSSLVLTATYTDDQGQDRSSEIQWESRNSAIAKVTNGTVSTLGIGWTNTTKGP